MNIKNARQLFGPQKVVTFQKMVAGVASNDGGLNNKLRVESPGMEQLLYGIVSKQAKKRGGKSKGTNYP